MGVRIEAPGGGASGSATNHATLSNLDYGAAGHTDFQQSIPTGTTVQFYRGDKTFALVSDTGTNCPVNATYIVQTANATLTNEQILADLNTGLLKVTSGTGLLSVASTASDYQIFIETGTTAQFYRGDKTWALVPDTGGGASVVYAPTGATYIVQVASATLTNEQALADLATGILKGTSGTGLVSIAVAGVDYESPVATGTAVQLYHGDKTFTSVVSATTLSANVLNVATTTTTVTLKATGLVSTTSLDSGGTVTCLTLRSTETISATALTVGTTSRLGGTATALSLISATSLTVGNAVTLAGTVTALSLTSATAVTANIVTVATTITSVTVRITELNTGLIKVTSGTGLLSIASTSSDYEAFVATGTSSQFYRGDKTWALVPDTGTGAGITWNNVTATATTMTVDNGYIANNAGLVTLTLPATFAIGKVFRIAGAGAGGWKVAQVAGQQIKFGIVTTTNGASGYLQSVNQYDAVELVTIATDTNLVVISSQGNITYV